MKEINWLFNNANTNIKEKYKSDFWKFQCDFQKMIEHGSEDQIKATVLKTCVNSRTFWLTKVDSSTQKFELEIQQLVNSKIDIKLGYNPSLEGSLTSFADQLLISFLYPLRLYSKEYFSFLYEESTEDNLKKLTKKVKTINSDEVKHSLTKLLTKPYFVYSEMDAEINTLRVFRAEKNSASDNVPKKFL